MWATRNTQKLGLLATKEVSSGECCLIVPTRHKTCMLSQGGYRDTTGLHSTFKSLTLSMKLETENI